MDDLMELLLKSGLVMVFMFIVLWGCNRLLLYFKNLATK